VPTWAKETGQLSRKARKQSKAQAAIQAALEIAQEHARIIEATYNHTDAERIAANSTVVTR
jgi:hypothetical protein